jgi:phosphopantothenoylcysteine decarboxylase/phosphopantothenate--cysteine ligase
MRIALGVSGGVAAYKAAELVRSLQQEGLDVQVVMTRGATEFITPLTFAALTGQRVITEMFDAGASGPANIESAIEHMAVAQRIDLLLVAPATANILGKFVGGIADDFLTTLYLATKAPVMVAPAMNVNMWEHAATQENVRVLRERGVTVVEPDEGYLACGMTGAGRLASNERIVEAVRGALGLQHDFDGIRVLVTAGPTCEDIDPVRYLTNRSSGKMGFALAEAAQRRGARVTLVSGPVQLHPPGDVEWVPVRTAAEMERAVREQGVDGDVIIMAAAVADYRAAAPATRKLKRGAGPVTMEFEPTRDILAGLAAHNEGPRGGSLPGVTRRGKRVIVGFAAETHDLAENAREKLRVKRADMIVGNDVTQKGAGFDVDTNIATLFLRDGREVSLPRMTKLELANRVLDEVRDLQLNGRD